MISRLETFYVKTSTTKYFVRNRNYLEEIAKWITYEIRSLKSISTLCQPTAVPYVRERIGALSYQVLSQVFNGICRFVQFVSNNICLYSSSMGNYLTIADFAEKYLFNRVNDITINFYVFYSYVVQSSNLLRRNDTNCRFSAMFTGRQLLWLPVCIPVCQASIEIYRRPLL